MNTKTIPVFLMLIAGSITSIITYMLHYPLKAMLWVLLVVLLLFYGIGCGVAVMFDKFEKENAEQASEEEELPGEGAVVEKEMTPEPEKEALGEETGTSAEM